MKILLQKKMRVTSSQKIPSTLKQYVEFLITRSFFPYSYLLDRGYDRDFLNREDRPKSPDSNSSTPSKFQGRKSKLLFTALVLLRSALHAVTMTRL